jgi:hypothetical protein
LRRATRERRASAWPTAGSRRATHQISNAFEAAAAAGREADLQAELEALFNEQNTSPSTDATSIPATFLRVTVAL